MEMVSKFTKVNFQFISYVCVSPYPKGVKRNYRVRKNKSEKIKHTPKSVQMVQAALGIHLTHRTNTRKNGRAILGMQRIVTQPKAKLFYPEMIFLHTHRLRHTHTHICVACECTVEQVVKIH